MIPKEIIGKKGDWVFNGDGVCLAPGLRVAVADDDFDNASEIIKNIVTGYNKKYPWGVVYGDKAMLIKENDVESYQVLRDSEDTIIDIIPEKTSSKPDFKALSYFASFDNSVHNYIIKILSSLDAYKFGKDILSKTKKSIISKLETFAEEHKIFRAEPAIFAIKYNQNKSIMSPEVHIMTSYESFGEWVKSAIKGRLIGFVWTSECALDPKDILSPPPTRYIVVEIIGPAYVDTTILEAEYVDERLVRVKECYEYPEYVSDFLEAMRFAFKIALKEKLKEKNKTGEEKC